MMRSGVDWSSQSPAGLDVDLHSLDTCPSMSCKEVMLRGWHTSGRQGTLAYPHALNYSATTTSMESDMSCAQCACGDQISEAEGLKRLDECIAEHRHIPGALIPVLQIAQGIFGHLPDVAIRRICVGLEKPYS